MSTIKVNRIENTSTTDGGIDVDSSGRVGVGTTSPGHALQVNGAICATGTFSTPSASTITLDVAGDARIMATGPGGGGYLPIAFAQVNSTGGGYSERARIDSSGRLLVGTSSADSATNLVEFEAATSTASQDLLIINGGQTGFLGTNDANTAQGIRFKACAYNITDGVQILDAARIKFQKVNSWNTTGVGAVSGKLIFEVASGTSASTTLNERMSISSGGKLTVPGVYSLTTTGGSAVYVESDGDLLRYTSSLKYKTDVETLEDARADAILNCRPVWYRSKCVNDIKTEGSEKSDWGWYGFIAEEVAEIEPRLVNWATKDAVTQEDGSVQSVERDPADYEAEGVRYDNFVPLLLNLVKRQQQAIEILEAKVAALEAS